MIWSNLALHLANAHAFLCGWEDQLNFFMANVESIFTSTNIYDDCFFEDTGTWELWETMHDAFNLN